MARTVRGARVLITGAASEMGRLYAERAVREGARAVVLWERDEPALTRLANALREELFADRSSGAWGGPPRSPSSAAGRAASSIHPFVLDVGELGAIAQTAQAVRRELGGIDVLINNAGVVRGGFFWEHDNGDDTRATMQVNALAPMYATGEFLPGMLQSPREARIVTVAATGPSAAQGMSVYAASTGAVTRWSEGLRRELEQQGFGHVKVTTVLSRDTGRSRPTATRDARLVPSATPESVADRVWRAMLAGRPRVRVPAVGGATVALRHASLGLGRMEFLKKLT